MQAFTQSIIIDNISGCERAYTIEAEAVANCSCTAAGLATVAFNICAHVFAILEYA